MVVVILIIAMSFGVIYYSSSNYRKHEFFSRLDRKALNTFEMFLHYDEVDPTILILFDRSQKDKLARENIRIYDSQAKQLYNSNDSNIVDITPSMVAQVIKKGRMEYSVGEFEMDGMRYIEGKNTYAVFCMAVDKYGLSKVENLRITMLLLLILIISIVALTGWVYAGRALKPLSEVINQVEKINVERLDRRLADNFQKDEIGRLITTFNIMLERVERSVKLQRLFMSGASHELKNPLTAITSQLQVVMLSDRSNEEYKRILQSVSEDIRRLNKTTLDLIEYASLSNEEVIQFTELRLDDVIWYCRDTYQLTHPECHVNLAFGDLPDNEKELIIRGNEALLKVAFNNLIDNACKFSKDASIWIHFEVLAQDIKISFKDKGMGMNPEELALIFEPFYRANNTAEVKGHGIGLALTKKVIELHKGKIDVQSEPNQGTVFTLAFKKSS
jgi:signal transduction histidine kinase